MERVFDRSIKAFLPGLLRMDRLAREMSAVTRVIVILERRQSNRDCYTVVIFIMFYIHMKKGDTEDLNQNLPAFKSMF